MQVRMSRDDEDSNMTTVQERVQDFLVQRSSNAYFDDCIADQLNLSVRQHANHKTRELAKLRGFKRDIGECTFCKGSKKVIRYA